METNAASPATLIEPRNEYVREDDFSSSTQEEHTEGANDGGDNSKHDGEDNKYSPRPDDELEPRRSWIHMLFLVAKSLTMLMALALGIGQIVGMKYNEVGPLQYVKGVYMIGLCILIICNELDLTELVRLSRVLSNWISRGLLYSFIGIVGLEQDVAVDEDGDIPFAAQVALLYIKIAACGMVAMGAIYFLMGAFCCKALYKKELNKWDERLQGSERVRYAQEMERINNQKRRGGGNSSSVVNNVV